MAHRVTIVPGDGIGPEVVEAARRVLEATGVAFEWDWQDAGAGVYEREGTPVPERLLASIRQHGVALKGPTTTPVGSGFRAVSVTLRRELDLYAGIRPCRALPGVRTAFPGIDAVVIRMNHEDLYAGIEFAADDATAGRLRELIRAARGVALGDDCGITIKPISRSGSERLARWAFAYARAHARRRVTVVHKATVMRATDGVFLAAAREVGGREFPEIECDEMLVDTLCHELVRRPLDFDVLVLPVQYGDIVSDLLAGMIGGLGMAPGANVGDACAVFEAAHGTVPKYAGLGRANPMALMLTGALLLRHLGEPAAADRLEAAVAAVVAEGKTVTFDLKASRDDPTAASTTQAADAVIDRLASGAG